MTKTCIVCGKSIEQNAQGKYVAEDGSLSCSDAPGSTGPHGPRCWNAFCVQDEHVGSDGHVDRTGRSWEQRQGDEYCVPCSAYHVHGECPNP